MTSKNPKPTLATYVGLFCALGIPLVIFPTRVLRDQLHLRGGLQLQEAIIWGLTAAVLCILIFCEKLPLSAIGLRRPTWSSFWWGLAGAVAVRLTAAIAVTFYARVSGTPITQYLARDLALIARLGSLPFAIILLLSLRAALTEEILFRGYAIERLGAVTGNRTFAALVSLAVFTICHLGGWDLNYLVVVAPVGLVLTLLYVWRRDLTANMIAHFLTDATGLVLAYAIAHHLIHVSGLPGSH